MPGGKSAARQSARQAIHVKPRDNEPTQAELAAPIVFRMPDGSTPTANAFVKMAFRPIGVVEDPHA